MLASDSARADLVVVGRHNGTGSSLAIGGILPALLPHARGPVAIVPDACCSPAVNEAAVRHAPLTVLTVQEAQR